MKHALCVAVGIMLLSPGIAWSKGGFVIEDVQLPKMSAAHLCAALGGAARPIAITIRHSPGQGQVMKVQMLDHTTSGATINHRATDVRADVSGTTQVSFPFIPPCNRSGVSTSNYSFVVSGGGATVTKLFGRYDSVRRQIVP